MAIDDPIEAAQKQIAAEERSASPTLRFVPSLAKIISVLAEFIPDNSRYIVMSAAQTAEAWVTQSGSERRNYLIDCLREEIQRVRANLENFEKLHQDFVEKDFCPLVMDGLQKAEQTRSRERIKRIAAILGHALEIGPRQTADVTEELMRIATNLGDQDVAVLRELVEGQRGFYDAKVGRAAFNEVNKYWTGANSLGYPVPEHAPAFKLGIREGELQVACAKLQSFGLVVQSESIGISRQPGFQAFAILPRAIEFVDSIKALSSDQKASTASGK